MVTQPVFYFNSLLGGQPKEHHILTALTIIITAAFGGFLVTSFHPEYLTLFENPIMQFFTSLMLFNAVHQSPVPTQWMYYDAIILTILLQLIAFATHASYGNGGKKHLRWTTQLRGKDIVAMMVTIFVIFLLMIRRKGYSILLVN